MKDISEKNTHPDPPVRDSLKVWNRNFSWLMGATITGASGAIAASYGLSFLVFYETGSTLASALVLAVRVIPSFLLPLIAGPLLDRLPRKSVLVWGDFINGILYLIMGLWLMFQPFSYISYLLFSLIIACTSSVDELAFDSILPLTITKGCEQKSYAVTSMVYPLLNVVMMPAAALIMQFIGIPILLVLQGVLAVFASLMDSRIRIVQDLPSGSGKLDLKSWISDIREAAIYLRHQKGLLSFFLDSAIANGIASGCSPAMIKFFTITPGFTPLMYSAFSGAESLGRVLGGMGQYVKEMKNEVKYRFSVTVLVIYPFNGRYPAVSFLSSDAGEPRGLRSAGNDELYASHSCRTKLYSRFDESENQQLSEYADLCFHQPDNAVFWCAWRCNERPGFDGPWLCL